jgi:hypothetical protein
MPQTTTAPQSSGEISLSDNFESFDDSGGAEIMDTFTAPDIGADDELLHEVQGVEKENDESGVPDLMGFEAFFAAFEYAFSAPQMFDREFQPLAIQDHERGQARQAAQVTYDLLEKHFPTALSSDPTNWIKYGIAGQFFVMKAQTVAAIFAHKKNEMRRATEGAANHNGPPSPASGPQSSGAAYVSPVNWMDAEGRAA